MPVSRARALLSVGAAAVLTAASVAATTGSSAGRPPRGRRPTRRRSTPACRCTPTVRSAPPTSCSPTPPATSTSATPRTAPAPARPPTPTAATPAPSRWAPRSTSSRAASLVAAAPPSAPAPSPTAPGWPCSRTVTTDPNTCDYNDFALVKVDAADVSKVNPSVPFWGGPVAVDTDGSASGETVYSYGNSSLRGGVEALSPKQGSSLGTQGDGWTHPVYTVSPGVPGDSGSAFLGSDGKALGTLSTLAIAPLAGSNGVGDLQPRAELRPGQRRHRRAGPGGRHRAVLAGALSDRTHRPGPDPALRGPGPSPFPRSAPLPSGPCRGLGCGHDGEGAPAVCPARAVGRGGDAPGALGGEHRSGTRLLGLTGRSRTVDPAGADPGCVELGPRPGRGALQGRRADGGPQLDRGPDRLGLSSSGRR